MREVQVQSVLALQPTTIDNIVVINIFKRFFKYFSIKKHIFNVFFFIFPTYFFIFNKKSHVGPGNA